MYLNIRSKQLNQIEYALWFIAYLISTETSTLSFKGILVLPCICLLMLVANVLSNIFAKETDIEINTID